MHIVVLSAVTCFSLIVGIARCQRTEDQHAVALLLRRFAERFARSLRTALPCPAQRFGLPALPKLRPVEVGEIAAYVGVSAAILRTPRPAVANAVGLLRA